MHPTHSVCALGARQEEYIKNHLFQFSDSETFSECIFGICDSFKKFIENEKGYTLLWNDDSKKPKPESALQTLMYGFTKSYGMLLNIDITRESNAGSGPVDFKYSQGYYKRVLIETKLVSNSKYWNGLKKQLPKYMLAEGIEKGIFILVAFTADEFNKANDSFQLAEPVCLPYCKVICVVAFLVSVNTKILIIMPIPIYLFLYASSPDLFSLHLLVLISRSYTNYPGHLSLL